MPFRVLSMSLTWLCLLTVEGALFAKEPDAAGIEFFEKQVRPVLVRHCYECHSGEKKIKGGLRLDSRDGWQQGGDSGSAIQPGEPDESLLIQAIRYDGDVQMPPKGKLPDEVIRTLENWVARGAPDPRTNTAAPTQRPGIDLAAGRKHWAYQLPHAHAAPAVRDSAWPRGAIDCFILARLEAAGLHPGPEAAREVLVRRVYFDLIGLPPTPEQIDEFLHDSSPDAYARLVDRLLDSPQFGERWGRHWLDVARFAESLTLRGFLFKEAWRYRDYVIDTFNADRPYNRFLMEQIAGDLLPADSIEERQRNLIATTYLVLGNTNLEEQDKQQLVMDVVDEQLDTIGKGMLAQTIGCARCHDHKFDPIPTADYYAMAGILKNAKAMEHANVSKWLEFPLPLEPEQEAEVKQAETRITELRDQIKRLTSPGKGAIAANMLPGIVVDDSQARKVGEWRHSQFSGKFVGDGYVHDQNNGKGEKTITFQPDLPQAGKYEIRLAYSAGTSRSTKVPVTVFSADGEASLYLNEQKEPPIDGRFVSLGQFRFEANGQGFVMLSTEGTQGHVTADAVQFLHESILTGGAASSTAANSEEVKRLQAELKALTTAAPPRPMVMSVAEEKEISDTSIHIRGSVHSLGPQVPRGFLQVATYGSPPSIPTDHSGRREFGEWLASENNPLPARVMVNRVWHWLFGAGLVRTTDNFGTTGELPSHPELLDTLAVEFMRDNWSIKRLVRRIVLSRTYQLSAAADSQMTAIDPENRLLAHANRRRLDAECLRDAMLLTSGELRLDLGGPTYKPDLNADFGYQHTDTRRSVYSPVFRNSLPDLFEAFDFADPSMVVGNRTVSTVAPQALFLLNHPFVLEQSRSAAQRLLDQSGLDDADRIDRAFRTTLGRAPTDTERAVTLDFLRSKTDADPVTQWAGVFQTLFASPDFRSVD